MQIKDLIKPVYDKKTFERLKSRITSLIAQVEEESNLLKIENIKKLFDQWVDFDKKFNIRKHRISDIESIGLKILKILDKRIDELSKINSLNPKTINKLKEELIKFRRKVSTHLEIQKIKYKQNASLKR